MTLSGAYGRDYKSKKEIETDLLAGKDFQVRSLEGSGYTSMQELLKAGINSVTVRYRADRSVTVIKLNTLEMKALKAAETAK
jgi:hypothetical protein